ncbi:two-component system response regulator, partial [Paracoccus yeei]
MDKRLSIVIIEPDPDRAEPIMAGLRDAGDHDIRIIAGETGLARRIAELRPDVVLIDLANPSRDILEELALASGPMERPVAM